MKIQNVYSSFPGALSGVAQHVQNTSTLSMASASGGLLGTALCTLKTRTLVNIATTATIYPTAFVTKLE